MAYTSRAHGHTLTQASKFLNFVHKIKVEPVRQRFNDSLKHFKIYKNVF